MRALVRQSILIFTASIVLMCVPLLLVCIVTQREMLALERLKFRPECLTLPDLHDTGVVKRVATWGSDPRIAV